MIIGTVKELMNNESRVGLDLDIVIDLIKNGHTVLVEKDAGVDSGISNDDYINVGAVILDDPAEVWNKSELLVKVKAPLPNEFKYFRSDLTIFCYLHLAAHPDLIEALIDSKTTAIAFETIETEDGTLPALKPMSAVAGRLSVLIGADYLRKSKGGSGLLMTGLSNIRNSNSVIVGAGNVGINALEVLVGFNTNVTVIDKSGERLRVLKQIYKDRIVTLKSTEENLRNSIIDADLVIGSVSIPGGKTPQLIKREYYQHMRKGSVIVDVAIDQGGSTEVSRPTTHDDPIFVVDGIIHYCVSNIPGDVPLTATRALSEGTKEYILLMANLGIREAIKESKEIEKGVNIIDGKIVIQSLIDSIK